MMVKMRTAICHSGCPERWNCRSDIHFATERLTTEYPKYIAGSGKKRYKNEISQQHPVLLRGSVSHIQGVNLRHATLHNIHLSITNG